ncbi:MAG: hypothetical protein LBU70_10430 [Chitinispirillales bacterium]|jgi:hypothetical protein|nr:hypothetical protein [Chitinispirillales bacterium]
MFTFTIPVKNPEIAFEKARIAIAKANGNLRGDGSAGSFSGSGVEGSYVFEGGVLSVTIAKKPFLATESLIKKEVAKFFA